MLETSEMENKSVNTPNKNVSVESGQKVVVRISRVDCNKR
jgi:ribosomal protein S1